MIFDMTKRSGGGGDTYAVARVLLENTATEYIDDTITILLRFNKQRISGQHLVFYDSVKIRNFRNRFQQDSTVYFNYIFSCNIMMYNSITMLFANVK